MKRTPRSYLISWSVKPKAKRHCRRPKLCQDVVSSRFGTGFPSDRVIDDIAFHLDIIPPNPYLKKRGLDPFFSYEELTTPEDVRY